MKKLVFAFLLWGVSLQAATFQHILLVIQENRTPDNLFYGLCGTQGYNINCGTRQHKGHSIVPTAVALDAPYDMGHSHSGWLLQYNSGLLDGTTSCVGTCPPNPNANYVNPTDVRQYLTLATQYGFANYMFQTNQGPSYPAHQFLFGGTSALDASGDSAGVFLAENANSQAGCLASTGTLAPLIRNGIEARGDGAYPCAERRTIADLGIGWKYYTPGVKNIWTAPLSINHICVANQPGGHCTGAQWTSGLDLNPSDVLTDIQSGTLAQLSFVVPTGQCSDHARITTGCGPAWVAAIVNAVGTSPYWQDTAIIVVWDDWGGWYDHEQPVLFGDGYEGGFRVPLLFVSAYTATGTISNTRSDFGSILRFVEGNFGAGEGILGFADARSVSNLSEFYDLTQTPRSFVPVNGVKWLSPQLLIAPDDDDDDDARN